MAKNIILTNIFLLFFRRKICWHFSWEHLKVNKPKQLVETDIKNLNFLSLHRVKRDKRVKEAILLNASDLKREKSKILCLCNQYHLVSSKIIKKSPAKMSNHIRRMGRLFDFKVNAETAIDIFNPDKLIFTDNYRDTFRDALYSEQTISIIITSRHGGRDRVTIYFKCYYCNFNYKATMRTQEIRVAKTNPTLKVRIMVSGHCLCTCSKYN